MFTAQPRGEILVIYTPVAASPNSLASVWKLLAAGERERADRFHFEEHRNRFIAGRGLLRLILGASTGTEPSSLEFAYGPQGKPSLARREPISFNLSGSKDSALYAVGDGPELGVDLEHIRPLDDMARVAERFFCPAEYRELLALPEHARMEAFFNCWTRKEAFIKGLGEGLSHPLDRFQVTLRPGQPAAFVSIDGRPGGETEWALHDVALPVREFAAALAVRNRSSNLRLLAFESFEACMARWAH